MQSHISCITSLYYRIDVLQNILGIKIKKGAVIKRGLTLGKKYYVKFKLFPQTMLINERNANVLHFTTGENSKQLGSRVPALWVRNGESLYFVSDVNGKTNYVFLTSTKYPANEVIDIIIQQVAEENKYFFEVIVNNEKLHRIENNQPKVFEDVILYVSDPWHPAQPGYITDLQYSEGQFNMRPISIKY